jgi:hypothetical protein
MQTVVFVTFCHQKVIRKNRSKSPNESIHQKVSKEAANHPEAEMVVFRKKIILIKKRGKTFSMCLISTLRI